MPREIMPGNPTEAGPESRNEPAATWSDNLEFADCSLIEARRFRSDDALEECYGQLNRIDAALDLIHKAQIELRNKMVALRTVEAINAR